MKRISGQALSNSEFVCFFISWINYEILFKDSISYTFSVIIVNDLITLLKWRKEYLHNGRINTENRL